MRQACAAGCANPEAEFVSSLSDAVLGHRETWEAGVSPSPELPSHPQALLPLWVTCVEPASSQIPCDCNALCPCCD